MDKSFWQSIKANNYAVPDGFTIQMVTPVLLSYLGSPDFELRDDFAYRILIEWFDRKLYTHAELWQIAAQMLQNLTVGLGGKQTDTIFLRSYSVLMLAELMCYDVVTDPTFSETEIQQIFTQVLAYFRAEQDLRSYDPEKKWMDAVAHASDCFFFLAQHRFVSAADLESIMNALVEKITTPVIHIYLYDEDERLTRPVMSALQRDLLLLPFLATWLEQFTHPKEGTAWRYTDKPETCVRHNSKHFLRSLYFQLRMPGFGNLPLTPVQQRPAIADELLPLLEETLAQIRVWF